LVVNALTELDELLAEMVAKRPRFHAASSGRGAEPVIAPHILILVDGGDTVGSAHFGIDGGLAGVTVLHVAARRRARWTAPRSCSAPATVARLASATLDDETQVGRPTACPSRGGEPRPAAGPAAPVEAVREQAPLAVDHDLTELLGIPDVAAMDLRTLWTPRPPRDVLRIPIGTGPAAARWCSTSRRRRRTAWGPHGLVVGRHRLRQVRTAAHAGARAGRDPLVDVLNFVLVDFKGGATFATLEQLPAHQRDDHQLEDALPLVDRMKDAMSGELTRRQEVLRRAGNFASIRDYDRARASGVDLPPLPSLLMVCDEFTEMLVAKPDFIDLFVQIGRIGRSIGVHLLLATQRLEDGRLRGLETNLSYRIALRTFSALESRMVLNGHSDAADLPSAPGHGFLQVGTEDLQRFKAAYVSGPYRRSLPAAGRPVPGPHPRLHQPTGAAHRYGRARRGAGAGRPAGGQPDGGHRRAVGRSGFPGAPGLAAAAGHRAQPRRTARRAGHRSQAGRLHRQPEPAILADGADGAGGQAVRAAPGRGVVRPRRGRRPRRHRGQSAEREVHRRTVAHHRARPDPHAAGGPGLLPRLRRRQPRLGAGPAARRQRRGPLDTAVVRRTVGEVATLLSDRERRFAARGIDSVAAFRQLRRPSDLDATLAVPEDGFGDVFLVVDGWTTLRSEFEDLEGC
jgi:S-DNA-T family DNA segregation ATPase FtsK/SpoIIIE